MDLKSAIHYHKLQLKVAKEEGDKVGEGRAYSNLEITYDDLGDFITAIDYHKRHLELVKEGGTKLKKEQPMVTLATLIAVWEISKQPLTTMNVN